MSVCYPFKGKKATTNLKILTCKELHYATLTYKRYCQETVQVMWQNTSNTCLPERYYRGSRWFRQPHKVDSLCRQGMRQHQILWQALQQHNIC